MLQGDPCLTGCASRQAGKIEDGRSFASSAGFAGFASHGS